MDNTKWGQACFILMMLTLAGCATQGNVPTESARGVSTSTMASDGEDQSEQRMIVKEGSLRLMVGSVNEQKQHIQKAIKGHDGYIASSNIYSDRSVSIDARVPSEKLEAIMNELETFGEVASRSISSTDLTSKFIDLNARLENKKELRDRLRTLTKKAEDVQTILDIEKELSRVQAEIDSLEGRIKNIRSREQMSQLHVSLERDIIYGPLGYVGYGLWWGVKKLFVLKE